MSSLKKTSIPFLIIIITMFMSCNGSVKRENFTIIDVQSVVDIKGQIVLNEDLMQFYDLQIYDTLAFFASSRGESVFRVYSTKDFKLLNEFGYNHAGPEYVDYPMFLKTKSLPDSVESYDINTRSFINAIFNKSSNSFTMEKELMDDNMWPVINLNKVSENVYFANSLPPFNKGLFFKYETETFDKKWIPFVKKHESGNDDYMTALNRNSIAINKSKSIVICCMKYFNKIFAFDFDGNIIREIQLGTNSIEPSLEIPEIEKFTENSETFFTTIVATDKFFYCLWNNKKINAKKKEAANSKVIIFDWQCNYVRTIQTDNIISAMDVHPKDSYFLGIVFNDEEDTSIYKYII